MNPDKERLERGWKGVGEKICRKKCKEELRNDRREGAGNPLFLLFFIRVIPGTRYFKRWTPLPCQVRWEGCWFVWDVGDLQHEGKNNQLEKYR